MTLGGTEGEEHTFRLCQEYRDREQDTTRVGFLLLPVALRRLDIVTIVNPLVPLVDAGCRLQNASSMTKYLKSCPNSWLIDT